MEEQLLEMERQATIKKKELIHLSSSKKALNFDDLNVLEESEKSANL